MNIREWANKNSALVTGISIVVFVGALVFLIFGGGETETRGPEQRWFYDLNTGSLFPQAPDVFPPVETESGDFNGEPAGVHAMVFSCGECNEDERFVAWLTTYPPEVKKALETMRSQGLSDVPEGTPGWINPIDPTAHELLATPDNLEEWFEKSGDMKEYLLTKKAARDKCKDQGKKHTYCYPN